MYLLDSDVLIWFLRRRREVVDLVESLSAERLAVSVATRFEVLAGAHEREKPATQNLLDAMVNLPITGQIADLAADFWRRYRRQGQTVQIADLFIAATAVVEDLVLITFNRKDFPMPEPRL